MTRLYRVTLKPTTIWNRDDQVLYVMRECKQDVITYVQEHIREGYKISKISYLGHEASGCMYVGGKQKKKDI